VGVGVSAGAGELGFGPGLHAETLKTTATARIAAVVRRQIFLLLIIESC